MIFDRVGILALGYVLPSRVVTSTEIESRLAPLYRRLKLPEGRLELISGVSARRLWDAGVLPSEKSIQAVNLAIEVASLRREHLGALIHGSVCRDHLEPATACRVHHETGLAAECVIYDTSNACLGILNGALQISQMIQLRQIDSGIVVGTESSGPLLEATLQALNADESLTREEVKSSLASLTIGSASVAMILGDLDRYPDASQLRFAVAEANTQHHELCTSGQDEAVALGMQPLMATDSESLLLEGIATGKSAFRRFVRISGWLPEQIDRTICHQVGKTHRRSMLEALELSPARDFSTVEFLGNTGSAALPVTLALATEQGFVQAGHRTALLGIGSGINALMLGVDWRTTKVAGVGSGHAPV